MATKRTKDLPSIDRSIPVPSKHHTDLKLSSDIETINSHIDNRLTKDDIASIFSESTNTSDAFKLAASARPTVEIVRSNSPTLKRLLIVRNKLEKHAYSMSHTNSNSRQSMHATHEAPLLSCSEKHAKSNVRISSSKKRFQSHREPSAGPIDKITYQKSWSHNGNVKQKCSLEIWLPKAGADDDEDDDHTDRKTPPDTKTIVKKPQSPQSISVKSRRSSITQIASNSDAKLVDETFSKKSEPIIVPRVYHYEDYLTDQSEERPRSSKSGNTYKSDGRISNKNVKHHHTRPHVRRLSSSTTRTDDTMQSNLSEKPMTSKNLLSNIKQTHYNYESKGTTGSNNSTMLNELMRKYSMMKKNHLELTQARLQLEKLNSDVKHHSHTSKDNSLPSPPVSDSASYDSSDHLSVSARKLFRDNSPPRSARTLNSTGGRLLERRSAHRTPSNPETIPPNRLMSIVKNFQRQPSASIPDALLPNFLGKKNDEPFRFLERSKTLNVMFDIPAENGNRISSSNLPTRPDGSEHLFSSSGILPRRLNGFEQIPTHVSKRSLPPPSFNLTAEEQQQKQPVIPPLLQLLQYQNIQNSAQRYHNPAHTSSNTDFSTNKALAHLKYSNGGNVDRNCLIPE